MPATAPDNRCLSAETRAFYCRAIATLTEASIPFLVGGAYAFARYTGIERHTKDFDVFLHRRDLGRALRVLRDAGCRTEVTFPHWLGKAYCGDEFVDLIYSSGNGIAEVDHEWFIHAVGDTVFDMPVGLIPAEEMIWSKGFIMERERFDGGDIAHVLHARGPELDWNRLLRRFGDHWRVLFTHLVLFGFVYPSHRDRIPAGVMHEMSGRLLAEVAAPPPGEPVCQGTILSRAQYLVDVEQWGYRDPRRVPDGNMTPAEIARWTAGIDQD